MRPYKVKSSQFGWFDQEHQEEGSQAAALMENLERKLASRMNFEYLCDDFIRRYTIAASLCLQYDDGYGKHHGSILQGMRMLAVSLQPENPQWACTQTWQQHRRPQRPQRQDMVYGSASTHALSLWLPF